jgi:Tfp pilus assembly protein PilN
MKTLHLNLLSPDKRKKFLNLVRFIFVKELLEITILVFSFITVIHLLGLLIISQTLADLSTSTLLINREQTAVDQEVRRINSLTKSVTLSGADFTIISERLQELFAVIPSTITLQVLDIDRKNNTILITGNAESRPALLNFQQILATIPWIKNVSTPKSQLFQKENVGFEIKGSIALPSPLKKS